MAAAKRSAEESRFRSSVNRLQLMFVDIRDSVQVKKHQLESTRRDCRELLKKWKTSRQKLTNQYDGRIQNMPKTNKSAPVKYSNMQENSVSDFRLDLNLADQLLLKAEKTRGIQNKLESSRKSKDIKANNLAAVNKEKEESIVTKIPALPQSAGEGKKSNTSCRRISEMSSRKVEGDFGVITQENLSKIQRKLKTAQVLPAHVTAPFKTEPLKSQRHLKSLHRQVRPAANKSARVAFADSLKNKQNHEGLNFQPKSNQNNSRNYRENQLRAKSAAAENKLKRGCASESSKTLSDRKNVSKNPGCSPEQYDNKNAEGGSNGECCQLNRISRNMGSSAEIENGFDLLKDWKDLKIPNKLYQLVRKNVKLKQQVEKSLEKQSSCRTFFQHLKNTSQSGTDQCPLLKVYSLKEKYDGLMDLLSSMKLEFTSELNSSSAREVLSTKRKLEFLLTTFHNLNAELKTIEEFYTQHSKTARSNARQIPEIELLKLKMPPSIWIPHELLQEEFAQIVCDDNNLYYQKVCELDRYSELIHQAQIHILQLHIMSETASNLLPLIKGLQTDDRDQVQIFRAVHGLLCYDGQHFLTFARDTIKELE